MTGREDIPNMSLQRSKELMLEYQNSHDARIFSVLLAKFDKYLILLVHRFKGKYKVLADEELQELYHVAILGFHKAIMGIREKHIPEYLFLFFTAFVKYELRTTYQYKIQEVSYDEMVEKSTNVEQGSSEGLNRTLTEFDLDIMRETLAKYEIEPFDAQLLEWRYVEGLTFREIGLKIGMSKMAAWKKVHAVITKLHGLLNKDS